MPAVLVQGQPNTGAHVVKVQASAYSGGAPKSVHINPSLAREVLRVDVNN